ncbi:MAG: hypothetical protein HY706_17945 [Candidatus Hydrogenedentes bacterium]|nr:hypothetical protein [Candidatus Hydrogenedentota bacterium]
MGFDLQRFLILQMFVSLRVGRLLLWPMGFVWCYIMYEALRGWRGVLACGVILALCWFLHVWSKQRQRDLDRYFDSGGGFGNPYLPGVPVEKSVPKDRDPHDVTRPYAE